MSTEPTEPRMDAPSGWRIETAMATWQAARSAILRDDPSLAGDEAELSRLLGPEEGDLDSILARLLRGARHAQMMAEMAERQIDDLRGREQRYARRSESMRGTALAIMDAVGKNRVELPDLVASIRAGSLRLILTREEFPEEYMKVSRSPDRAAIRADLKQGVMIEGAELAPGLPSLAIRTT